MLFFSFFFCLVWFSFLNEVFLFTKMWPSGNSAIGENVRELKGRMCVEYYLNIVPIFFRFISVLVIPQLYFYPSPFKSSLSAGGLQHVHAELILFVKLAMLLHSN